MLRPKAPRRELRTMLPRVLHDRLVDEAEQARRTISAQLEVVLEERYGIAAKTVEVAEG